MSINVPKEINGVYYFECGDEVYTYRTQNNKEYSNTELKNIIINSFANGCYYNEPCTMWNDPDGNLVMFPRNEKSDKDFLSNALIILKHTKSESKKQLINKILNECLIVDEEPILKQNISLNENEVHFDKVENFGTYHIDRYKLKDIYRDAINCSVHKYIKKYSKSHYNENEEKEIQLLLNEE